MFAREQLRSTRAKFAPTASMSCCFAPPLPCEQVGLLKLGVTVVQACPSAARVMGDGLVESLLDDFLFAPPTPARSTRYGTHKPIHILTQLLFFSNRFGAS